MASAGLEEKGKGPMDLDDERPPHDHKREIHFNRWRELVESGEGREMAAEQSASLLRLLDRVFTSGIVKRFQDLSKALIQKGSSKEECERRYHLFLKELAIYEHSMSKAKVALDTMATENTTYDENVRTIKAQVQETQRNITSLKRDLESAQKERAHREECVALANLINQLPTRAETKRKIDKETEDLKALQVERQQIENELDTRRKQFALFHYALTEIQQSI